jgi:hypothetical protein
MSTNTNQLDLTTSSINNSTKDGTTPSNTGGITVTPQVWAKMKSLLALLPAKPITNSPNAANQPIGLPDIRWLQLRQDQPVQTKKTITPSPRKITQSINSPATIQLWIIALLP